MPCLGVSSPPPPRPSYLVPLDPAVIGRRQNFPHILSPCSTHLSLGFTILIWFHWMLPSTRVSILNTTACALPLHPIPPPSHFSMRAAALES